jgi:membrane protein
VALSDVPSATPDRGLGRVGGARAVWTWLVELYACIDKGRTFGLAAETAFWLFLSMIPLAAVAGLLAARLSMNNWQSLIPVLGSLPWSTRELIRTELVTVARWNGGAVGLTSAVAFVWAASSGLHAIFDALEVEAGVERAWIRKRIMALGTCVALSLAVALLAVLGPGIEAAVHFVVGRRLPLFDLLSQAVSAPGRIFRFAVSVGVAFGYTCLLYRFGVPQTRKTRRLPVLPGALIAVGSQTLLSFLYTFYVTRVGGDAAYGTSLAIVAITLMALYLFALSLLVGAVINRKVGAPDEPCPPHEQHAPDEAES